MSEQPDDGKQLSSLSSRIASKTNLSLEQSLTDRDKYLIIQMLFNKDLAPIITDLNRYDIDRLTRIETWIKSIQALFDIEDSKAEQIMNVMVNSYRLNLISKTRKSRTEVVNMLRSDTDQKTTVDKRVGALGIVS